MVETIESPQWPIVVGGCYRSGTSMVRRLLNAHSRIHCPAELKFFMDFHGTYAVSDRLAHLRFAATAKQFLPPEEVFDVLGGAFVELHHRAARRAGAVRWADKAPENVIFLDDWGRLLDEQWHFLLVVRNPLDTVASISQSPFPLSIPAGLEGWLDTYCRFLESGLEWIERHPTRGHMVIYEELVASPHKVVSGMMEAVGERFEDVQLQFDQCDHGSGLEDRKVSSTGAIHSDSLHQWPKILTPDSAAAVWKATQALWQRIDPALAWCVAPDRLERDFGQ